MRHLSATVVYKCRNKVCSMNAVSALKAQCNLPIVPFVPCCADGACLHRLIGAGRAENRDFMGTMKQSVSTTNTFMILSALFLARYTHLLAYLRPTPILPQGNLPKNSGIERTSVSFWLNHLSLFCVSLLLGKKEKHLSGLIGVLNSTSENAKKNGNAATQRQKVRTHCSSFVWVLHLFCFCSSKPPLCRRCIPDYARMVTQGRSLVQRTYVLVSQFFFFLGLTTLFQGEFVRKMMKKEGREALQHSQVPSCCCCSPGVAVFTHSSTIHCCLDVSSLHTHKRPQREWGLIATLSALPDWLPVRRIYGVCGLVLQWIHVGQHAECKKINK